jgi:hypothetical protein
VDLRIHLVEPPLPQPPADPTETEQWLDGEAQQLRKDLENLAGQLGAQVHDNKRLSPLNQ